MKRRLFAVLAMAAPLSLLAAPAGADDALGARVEAAAQAFLHDQGLPGVSIGIMRAGRPVVVAGYGSARLEPARGAEARSRYDIGSVTKQFVAAAVMLLARDGKLSLDDPVAKYVPSAASSSAVRIRDLLDQTAGYVDYYPMDYVTPEMQRPTTTDRIIAQFATLPLEFAPGSQYSYSNTNYTLAGKIVEIAAGEPLASYLHRSIFAPLGMHATSCGTPRRFDDPLHAVGYTRFALGPLRAAVHEGSGWAGAAGCLTSDAGDLLLWDAALAAHRVVDAAAFAQMAAPVRLTDGTTSDYGFGLSSGSWHGHRYVVHDGGVAGFSSFNMLFPGDNAALVVLVNADNAEFGKFVGTLLRLMFNVPPAAPATAAPATAPPLASTPAPLDREAAAVIASTVAAFQHGAAPRASFSADFNAWLTPALERDGVTTLAPLGPPVSVSARVSRNHGTEFTEGRVVFASRAVAVQMRRTPDKTISQFLIAPAP